MKRTPVYRRCCLDDADPDTAIRAHVPGAFENTVVALYKYVVPKPKSECSKGEQLGVSFAAGYIAGVFCAIVSHPADNMVRTLSGICGRTWAVEVLWLISSRCGRNISFCVHSTVEAKPVSIRHAYMEMYL